MDHLSRLLMQSKKEKTSKGMYIVGFVWYDPGKKKTIASGTIWDGIARSGGEVFYSEHDTLEEALTACEHVEARYANSICVNYLMDLPDFL